MGASGRPGGNRETPMSAPSLDDIVEALDFLDDWEERYRYLIELGRGLRELAAHERTDDHRVEGCVSNVWLVAEKDGAQPDRLRFRADSDAHITKGLVALLVTAYDARTPADILAFDSGALFQKLGLDVHLSPTRSNGLHAMDRRIKAIAQAHAA